MKTALICGISGQDGALLAALLLGKGYRVVGTSRDAGLASTSANLAELGVRERVELVTALPTDLAGIAQALERAAPDEVYNLAGQSSVGLSFERPLETIESVSGGTLNVLEAVRRGHRAARIFNACSGECFGETDVRGAIESTPMRPRSPYAVAKAASFWTVATYREAYGLFACSGILFNHESPLRPARFVTRKIVAAACRIAAGSDERLALGNVDVKRDWGWAPEYVEAMWRTLQADAPDDFVIATGRASRLEEFVEATFAAVGIDAKRHVDFDPALVRPTEIMCCVGDPTRARVRLKWQADSSMVDVARKMIEAERARAS